MEFDVNKFISPFIQSQFPEFYLTDGPNFIAFVKAYYEWAESEGNFLNQSRSLFDYRDIDNTLPQFLEHFQKKYLYGIPFNIIANKQFLLKHVLDVYRSKGSIQCYKLLFRLIYDEDVDVYLPGRDLFKLSDGTWNQEFYLEVTSNSMLPDLVGHTIIGVSSGALAVVESFTTESINQNIINTLYISDMNPPGASFLVGEVIIDYEDYISGENLANIISSSPVIIGSLGTLNILNGGQNFNIGDQLEILHRDGNNNVISFGVNGLVSVADIGYGAGSLAFNIVKPGFGLTANALVWVYPGVGDSTGSGATFSIGTLFNTQNLQYNTDIIADYLDVVIGATAYGMPLNPTANSSTTLAASLTYTNAIFGSVLSLNNIKTGNNYTNNAIVFVRSIIATSGNTLPGTLTYNTGSNNITGVSTEFARIFVNGDVIAITANSSVPATLEYQVIKTVTSNTSITLYGPPSHNSTSAAVYQAAPSILNADYPINTTQSTNSDGTLNGLNTVITGVPQLGLGVANQFNILNSGKAYLGDELVTLQSLNANNPFQVTAQVIKGSVGHNQGSWSTTQGFLSSDKKLLDSYFYQNYSYELRTALQLDKYKDILYKTFHIAGTALFGEFLGTDIITTSELQSIVSESNSALVNANVYITADIYQSWYTADNSTMRVDAETIL
jgi:hypothetical protein